MNCKTIKQNRLWRVDFKEKSYYIDPEKLNEAYISNGYNPYDITKNNIKQKLSRDRFIYAEFLESVSRFVVIL